MAAWLAVQLLVQGGWAFRPVVRRSFAFATSPSDGNPAGVVAIDRQDWPADEVLAGVAADATLTTAFLLPREGDTVRARFFTATGEELPICGHAGLAAAHSVLPPAPEGAELCLEAPGGTLRVHRGTTPTTVGMTLPSRPATAPLDEDTSAGLRRALGVPSEGVVHSGSTPEGAGPRDVLLQLSEVNAFKISPFGCAKTSINPQNG